MGYKRRPINGPYGEPPGIGEVLSETLERKRLVGRIGQLLSPAKWSEIAGGAIARNSCPIKVQKKVLILRVTNSVWMHELQYLKPDLIERINTLVGRRVIEDMEFRVGKLDRKYKPSKRNKKEKAPELPEPDELDIQKAYELTVEIEDEDLKEAIRRAYIKSLQRRKADFLKSSE